MVGSSGFQQVGVEAVVKNYSMYMGQIDAMNAKTSGMASKLGSVLKVGALAGGAAIVGFAAVSIKAFADFDAAMTQSIAIMGEISGPTRKKLEDAAREVAKTTTFSAKEAADSLFFLASAGLDAEASMAAMPVVARFAQAGMFDMALATEYLMDAQSALGLAIKDDAVANMENMIRVSDVLVKANILSNASTEEFAAALTNKTAAALRLVGKDMEEGVAVLAAFAEQGTKGTEAGEKLNIVLRDLQTAAINNAEGFASLNIQVFDANGEMRNIADIIGDLESALSGMSDEQKRATLMMLGFQDRSVSAIATLLGTSQGIRDFEAALRDAGGTTEEIATKQLETLSAKLTLLKNRFNDVLIEVGSRMVPTLVTFSDWIMAHDDDIDKYGKAIADAFETGGKAAKEFILILVEFARNTEATFGPAIKGMAEAGIDFYKTLDSIGLGLDDMLGLLRDIGQFLSKHEELVWAVVAAWVAWKAIQIANVIITVASQVGALTIMLFKFEMQTIAATAATKAMQAAMLGIAVGGILAGFVLLPPAINTIKGAFSDADEKARAFKAGAEAAAESLNGLTWGDVALQKLVNDLDEIQTAFAKAPDWAQAGFGSAMAGVVQSAVDAGASLQEVMELVNQAGAENIPEVEAILQSLREEMAEDIVISQEMEDEFIQGLKAQRTAAETDIPAIAETLAKSRRKVEDAWTGYWESVDKAMEGSKGAVRSLLPTLETEVDAWLEQIERATAIYTGYEENLRTALEMARERFPEHFDQIIGIIRNASPEQVAALADMTALSVEEYDKGMSGLIIAAEFNANTATRKVLEEMGWLPPELREIGFEATSQFGQGLSGPIGGILSALDIFAGNVKAKADITLSPEGENAATSFATGVENKKEAVLGRINSFFFSIPEKVRDLLGMKSPSRTFADIGRNVIAGFTEGMLSSKDAPVKAVEEIVELTQSSWQAAWNREIWQNQIETDMGKIGLDLILALQRGMEEGGQSNIDAISRSADSIIEVMEKQLSSERALELGTRLITGISMAIETSSPEALESLGGVLAEINGELELAAEELEEAGEEITKAVAGGMTAEDAMAALKAANQVLADAILRDIAQIPGRVVMTLEEAFADAWADSELEEQIGQTGANLIGALEKAIADGTPEALVAVGNLASSVAEQWKDDLGPKQAREYGERLTKLLAAAIESGSPEAIQAVVDLIDDVQEKIDKAKEPLKLSLTSFAGAFDEVLGDKALLMAVGRDGVALMDALGEALAEGGEANISQLAEMASDMQDALKDNLPAVLATHLGDQLMAALEDAISGGGSAAIAALDAILRQINDLLAEETGNVPGEIEKAVNTLSEMRFRGNATQQWGFTQGELQNLSSILGHDLFTAGELGIGPTIRELNELHNRGTLSVSRLVGAIGQDALDALREQGLAFAQGGIVPGRYLGEPKVILAHAGEIVSPARSYATNNQMQFDVTVNIAGSASRENVRYGVRDGITEALRSRGLA